MNPYRSFRSKMKQCLVVGAVLVGALGAVMATPPAAHADQIYYEFPIGSTGYGTVYEYDPATGNGTWYWYDANGNWGVMS